MREKVENKGAPFAAPSRSGAYSFSVVVIACAVGLLLILLVISGSFVLGSKAGHWVYPLDGSIRHVPLWLPALVLLSLSASIFGGGRFIHSHEKATLIFCYLNAVFLETVIHKVYPVSLGVIVQSNTANSFYSAAIHHSAAEILANFNQLAASLPLHASSNMPGKILFYEFLKLFTSSPRTMGFVVIAVSSLGGLLLYGICRRLFQDRQIAFYALILYWLVPCKLFFFPLMNTVTPVVNLLCLYLFVAFLQNKHVLLAWLLGIGLYVQCLFEPLPLVTGIIFLGLLLLAIYEKRMSVRDLGKLALYLGLGFLSVYLFLAVFFSFHLFPTLSFILKSAENFNVVSQRGYWIWVGEDVKAFAYAVGVPVTVIVIYMAARIFTQRTAGGAFVPLSIESVFVVSLIVTFFVLDFMGINRGEVTRLWIFLAVLFQVPAAIFMAKNVRSVAPFFLIALVLAAQSMITLQRVGFILP